MKAMTEYFGDSYIPAILMMVSAIATFTGLLLSKNPIHLWLFNLPFTITAGLSVFVLVVDSGMENHPLALTPIEHVIFLIVLMIAVTWERING